MTKEEIFESKSTTGTGDLTDAGKDDGECDADGQRTVETQTSEEITGIPPGIDSEVPRRNRKPPVKKKPAVLSVEQKSYLRQKFNKLCPLKNSCSYCCKIVSSDHLARWHSHFRSCRKVSEQELIYFNLLGHKSANRPIISLPTMNQSYSNNAFGHQSNRGALSVSSVALPSMMPNPSPTPELHNDSISPIDLLVAASSVAQPSRNVFTHNIGDIRVLEHSEESENEYEEESEDSTGSWDEQNEVAKAAANDADADDINRLIQSEQEKQDCKRRKL